MLKPQEDYNFVIDFDFLLKQAHMTAHDYAVHTLSDLCQSLDIDRTKQGWQESLAPFARVWAAMIEASTRDYDTMVRYSDNERKDESYKK